jgi:chaperonin GroEL
MAVEKKLLFGNDARSKILAGITKCAKVVQKTYGPNGHSTVVYKGTTPFITKDGIHTLESISFRDELENIGASLIKEASKRANYLNGDGSSATAILTALLCGSANRLINLGLDTADIRDGFRIALEDVLSRIDTVKTPIASEDAIRNIARISANNDDEIASFITRAFTQLGDNGVVVIADSMSRLGKTDITFSTGCNIESGYVSSKCVNTTNDTCELQHPLVLISIEPLRTFEEITPFLQYAQAAKQPLVILAPDFEEVVSAGFENEIVTKHIEGSLILAPGSSRPAIKTQLQDIATLLNAQILGLDTTIDAFSFESSFGTCERLVLHPRKTEIVGPDTDVVRLDEYIKALQERTTLDAVDEALSEYEAETIKERIARLTGGIATIYVGSRTSIELGEKKDRYEDAVNAVRAALAEGIVPGAGTAFLRIGSDLIDEYIHEECKESVKTAAIALLDTIGTLSRILIKSAGLSPDKTVPQILATDNFSTGFNGVTRNVEDLYEAGVVDPVKVVKNSLLYAENVAESFMSIDCAIISDLGALSIEKGDTVLMDEYFGEQ